MLLALCVFPAVQASDSSDKARRPPPTPDPLKRAIPELVCTGDRSTVVANASLLAQTEASPLRLRLRGNLLYVGANANSEKFFGLINRTDRRRWTSGTATLLLDEPLQTGVWSQLTMESTRVSAVYCEPVDAKPR